jgi:hypothetical protein
MTDSTENTTKSLAIGFEEAEAIMYVMVVAWDESLLPSKAAKLAMRLIETFGDSVLPRSERSWFVGELQRQLAED